MIACRLMPVILSGIAAAHFGCGPANVVGTRGFSKPGDTIEATSHGRLLMLAPADVSFVVAVPNLQAAIVALQDLEDRLSLTRAILAEFGGGDERDDSLRAFVDAGVKVEEPAALYVWLGSEDRPPQFAMALHCSDAPRAAEAVLAMPRSRQRVAEFQGRSYVRDVETTAAFWGEASLMIAAENELLLRSMMEVRSGSPGLFPALEQYPQLPRHAAYAMIHPEVRWRFASYLHKRWPKIFEFLEFDVDSNRDRGAIPVLVAVEALELEWRAQLWWHDSFARLPTALVDLLPDGRYSALVAGEHTYFHFMSTLNASKRALTEGILHAMARTTADEDALQASSQAAQLLGDGLSLSFSGSSTESTVFSGQAECVDGAEGMALLEWFLPPLPNARRITLGKTPVSSFQFGEPIYAAHVNDTMTAASSIPVLQSILKRQSQLEVSSAPALFVRAREFLDTFERNGLFPKFVEDFAPFRAVDTLELKRDADGDWSACTAYLKFADT